MTTKAVEFVSPLATTGIIRRLIIRALPLAVGLALVMGTASNVGAAPVPAGGDSHQQACRGLQDRNNQLESEYKAVGVSNPGSSRLDDILAELRRNAQTWLDIKCHERYGTIYREQLPDSRVIVDLEPDNSHLAPVDSTLLPLTVSDTDLQPATLDNASPSSELFGPGAGELRTTTDPAPAAAPAVIDVPAGDLGTGGINPVPAEGHDVIHVPAEDLGSGGVNPVPAEEAGIIEVPADDLGTGGINPAPAEGHDVIEIPDVDLGQGGINPVPAEDVQP